MIRLECTDFKDAYLSLNRLYINHPEKVEFMDVCKGYIRDVFITAKSSDISIDISQLGYTKHKWTHLINQYLVEEDILSFAEKINNITSLSATFYFRNKKPKGDACLVGLVIGRTTRKEPWSTLSVMYRACHTERKLAVDLVMIKTLLEEYWNVNPDKISIYIPYCFCEAEFINGVWDIFVKGMDREKIIPDTPFMRSLISSYNNRFKEDNNPGCFKAMKRLQDLHFNKLDLKPVLSDTLSIKEVIKR